MASSVNSRQDEPGFFPKERVTEEVLKRQAAYFSNIPEPAASMLDVVDGLLLVLNRERQIVFASKNAGVFAGVENREALFGKRPGEALECVHAVGEDGHCGSTVFCRTCGAAKAIASTWKGNEDLQDCHIIVDEQGHALDIRVRSKPLELNGELFTIFWATDISHEKRRQLLESTFFHDVLNSITALKAFSSLVESADVDRLKKMIPTVARLIDEISDLINMQKELVAAENGELSVIPVDINSVEMLNEVINSYATLASRRRCEIIVENGEDPFVFISDPILIRRVLSNMVKNALEASGEGEKVVIGSKNEEKGVSFWVHNPAYMPPEVQLQIFQRSFSTKGQGRGIGTYSMHLLTKRYLNGDISFRSTRNAGTTFTATYPHRLDVN